jgi:hypothetical protein
MRTLPSPFDELLEAMGRVGDRMLSRGGPLAEAYFQLLIAIEPAERAWEDPESVDDPAIDELGACILHMREVVLSEGHDLLEAFANLEAIVDFIREAYGAH